MTWQGENKYPCQVTVGVDVTGIDVSITFTFALALSIVIRSTYLNRHVHPLEVSVSFSRNFDKSRDVSPRLAFWLSSTCSRRAAGSLASVAILVSSALNVGGAAHS